MEGKGGLQPTQDTQTGMLCAVREANSLPMAAGTLMPCFALGSALLQPVAPQTACGIAVLGMTPSIALLLLPFAATATQLPFVPPPRLKPFSRCCPRWMPWWLVLMAKTEPRRRRDEARPELCALARENSLCWSMEKEWPFMVCRLQKHDLLLGF